MTKSYGLSACKCFFYTRQQKVIEDRRFCSCLPTATVQVRSHLWLGLGSEIDYCPGFSDASVQRDRQRRGHICFPDSAILLDVYYDDDYHCLHVAFTIMTTFGPRPSIVLSHGRGNNAQTTLRPI